MSPPPDDPLEFVGLDDIFRYGSPETWSYLGNKPGSPVDAHSPKAPPGTKKHYDIYRTDDGEEFELHYFRHPDGTVGNVEANERSP